MTDRDDLTAPELLELEVSAVDFIAVGVNVISLVSAAGQLPTWQPGAHIEVHLSSGLIRHYSLCGPKNAPYWQIAVLNQPSGRGGSQEMHALSPGDRIKALGPRNNFPLESAERYVFIAGGIGITPILPMLESVQVEVDVSLWFGGSTRNSMAFVDRIECLSSVELRLWPEDEFDRLPIREILHSCDESCLIYVCGPSPLIEAVRDQAETLGMAGRVRFELFQVGAFSEAKNSGQPIQVHLEQTGLDLVVGEDESILDAIEREGVPVLASCREGTCGTCLTKVLHGQIDHRDYVLTAKEREAGDEMLICVSRANSPLTLDL